MSTKVFVGNLSFKTREPDLAKFFEEIGPVKSTNIIARGPRSLGYGFVEYEQESDAAKAVDALNKKELDGRPINVELAKPREPGAPLTAAPRRRPRAPRRVPAVGESQPAAAAAAPASAPRRRAPMRANPAPVLVPGAPADGVPVPGPAGARPPRRPRRGPRVAAPPANATPSTTTLFVANLPFVVDDIGLLEIFDGMNVKEAHVVRRPNGRSKGYGFVTFENEADQRHALEATDKSTVEGREIAVSPALTPFRKPLSPVAPAAAAVAVSSPAAPAAAAPAAAPAAGAAPAADAAAAAPAAAAV